MHVGTHIWSGEGLQHWIDTFFCLGNVEEERGKGVRKWRTLILPSEFLIYYLLPDIFEGGLWFSFGHIQHRILVFSLDSLLHFSFSFLHKHQIRETLGVNNWLIKLKGDSMFYSTQFLISWNKDYWSGSLAGNQVQIHLQKLFLPFLLLCWVRCRSVLPPVSHTQLSGVKSIHLFLT